MKKIITKFLATVIIFSMFLFFVPMVFACEESVSFSSHLAIVKNMLQKKQYTALANKYFTKNIKVGPYQSEYNVISKAMAKKTMLKPYAFKVIYKREMTEVDWENHFTAVSAQKRGIVVAKVMDKKTKEVFRYSDGSTLMYIFQVIKQKGKTKIPAILNSSLNIIESDNLIP